jgi:hypothetical protein
MSNGNKGAVEYNKGGTLPCSNCCSNFYYMCASDQAKTKGRISLYCPACSVKHWGEASDLFSWAREQGLRAKQAARLAKQAANE